MDVDTLLAGKMPPDVIGARIFIVILLVIFSIVIFKYSAGHEESKSYMVWMMILLILIYLAYFVYWVYDQALLIVLSRKCSNSVNPEKLMNMTSMIIWILACILKSSSQRFITV